MQLYQIECHNVQSLVSAEGCSNVLCRVPAELQQSLHPWTAKHFRFPANTELRFRSTAPVVLSVSVQPEPIAMDLYFGDYFCREELLSVGENRIEIPACPDMVRRGGVQTDFAPDLIRVQFLSAFATLSLNGVTSAGVLTPPEPSDVPRLRYLAYGSSITHGFHATSPSLSYCFQAARRMHADLQNLGVGGSAYLEPELGSYIADDCEFDIFTAEISVNMLNQGYTEVEFYHRAKDFLTRIDRRHPQALKAVISILPCFWDAGFTRPGARSTAEAYRRIAREVCDELSGKYLFLDGTTLMSPSNLSADLIHPGDIGMIELGANLADRLMTYAPQLFTK